MIGLLKQEFKTLFKSPASFSILIIPIVLMVGLGFLIPSAWIVPSSITIGIVGVVLLYFGGSLEEIKRTSFMKSISLTRLNKFTFLATKILFSIFISFISILWVLFFGFIFSTGPLAFLATDFSHLIPNDPNMPPPLKFISNVSFDINWNNIHWVTMFYSGVITIIVSISLAFVFVTFSKSSLSFYLMSFGYLMAMILFGGVIMPSFLISPDTAKWFKYFYYVVPNYYTNNIMADSFNNGMGTTVHSLYSSLISITDPMSNDDVNAIFSFTGGDLLPSDAAILLKDWLSGGTITLDNSQTIHFKDYSWIDFQNLFNNGGTIIKWDTGGLFGKHQVKWSDFNAINDSIDKVWANPLLRTFVLNSYQGHEFLKIDLGMFNIDIPGIVGAILNPLGVGVNVDGNTINITYGLFISLNNRLGVILNAINQIAGTSMNTSHGDIVNFLIGTVNPFLKEVDSMFSSMVNWADWAIPWIETTVFLGISTTFFKWS